MKYEIVNLEEKTVAGLTIRTKNSDPNMFRDIGTLWQKFYEQGVYASIPNKRGTSAIGLYSDYESDASGAYDCTVCCEISSKDNMPAGLNIKTIPAGKYAEFTVKGGMDTVGAIWAELWQMGLDRKYSCDFEEYEDCGEENNWLIHIYISLN